MRFLVSPAGLVLLGTKSAQGLEPKPAGAPPVEVLVLEHPDALSCCHSRRVVIPTSAVLRDGREIDRIIGDWGPGKVFRLRSPSWPS
jgi:hypothetical protein